MEKVNMKSMDIVGNNIEKIGALFPNCITEVKKDNGQIEKAIDFDKLRQELSRDLVEGKKERYEFTWPDKRQAIVTANAPISKTLRPCREKSVDFDTTQNVYIEGDNLDALKLLQETYLGKIKMIYIDPPYNTSNDLVYKDDYSQKSEDYLKLSGDADEQGNKLTANKDSNGRFHTDWLNMMYPRLILSRNLLSDDGLIFISIDDNEQSNLKKICDEIFGPSNFITCISRSTGTPTGGGFDGVVNELDYIVLYAKNISNARLNGLPMDEESSKIYDMQDEFGRFLIRPLRRTGGEDRREDRPTMFFPISSPDGTLVYPIGPTGYESRWICSPDTVQRLEKEHLLYWKSTIKNGQKQWSVYQKFYLENRTKSPGNLWINEEGNKKATKDIRNLFDGEKVFDFPKPIGLIEKILQIGSSEDSVVLDFFAGSSTTAHALMQLNAKCNTKRKYVLVQIAEKCSIDSEAYRNGYNTITELGEERIRRAGKKIKEEAGLMADGLDIGFRVFKIDDSNMKDIYYRPDEFEQDLLADVESNIKEDRTSEDLLFQVMIDDLGIPLSAKIKTLDIHGKKVFNVEDGHLVACFDSGVTDEVITAMAKLEPNYAVLRDSSYESDSVAVNFEQIFKKYSPSTETKIL